jgi:hypothetical protein
MCMSHTKTPALKLFLRCIDYKNNNKTCLDLLKSVFLYIYLFWNYNLARPWSTRVSPRSCSTLPEDPYDASSITTRTAPPQLSWFRSPLLFVFTSPIPTGTHGQVLHFNFQPHLLCCFSGSASHASQWQMVNLIPSRSLYFWSNNGVAACWFLARLANALASFQTYINRCVSVQGSEVGLYSWHKSVRPEDGSVFHEA